MAEIDRLQSFETTVISKSVGTNFDQSAASVSCPYCGGLDHAVFGQSVMNGKLRWYRSITCPISGNAEEDGTGSGPIDLRAALLKSQGTWEVLVESADRLNSVQIAKRTFGLSNADSAALLRSFPHFRIGTKAEAEWLAQALSKEGIRATARLH